MRYFISIIILLTCFDLQAQRRNERILYFTYETDTTIWYNKEIQSQLKDVHGEFILFYLSWRNNRIRLDPQKDPPGRPRTISTMFQFGFGAAEEIWERRFGQRFPEQLLLDKLRLLNDEQKEHLSFSGRIYRDSIFIQRSWQVPVMELIDPTLPADSVKNHEIVTDENGQVDTIGLGPVEEDKTFERIMGLDGDFTGGVDALHTLIDREMKDFKFEIAAGDSIMYFQGVIKRDSMLHDLELVEPIQSNAFTKELADILVKPYRQWLPIRKDRILNAYILIYVRVRPDGTLEVDYD